ncbi:MAG: tyrosine decarboxylase MfnA [Candidatus Thermoplasmatota archaeon]
MHRFPRRGLDREKVMAELHGAKARDRPFINGRVLSSMCTQPLEIAVEAHGLFIEANLGNPGLYPGTQALERKVIAWLSDLYHGRGADGHVVSGGTEANITALWLARNLAPGKKEVVYPRSAHFSVRKACDLLGLRGIEAPLNPDFTVDVEAASRAISKSTAAVIGIAGTTEVGAVDDIEALAEAADGAFLHVDAAYGGFVLPFLPHGRRFDFGVEGVCSLATDPHKMGLSTIPSGILLVRDARWFNVISVEAPYLTMVRQSALSGTRCSAAVAATYAAMRSTGFEGYVQVVRGCFDIAWHLAKLLEAEGFALAVKPTLPILNIALRSPAQVQSALLRRGWHVSVSREPRALRLVVMPHVTLEAAERFAEEMRKVARRLGEL